MFSYVGSVCKREKANGVPTNSTGEKFLGARSVEAHTVELVRKPPIFSHPKFENIVDRHHDERSLGGQFCGGILLLCRDYSAMRLLRKN